MSSALSRYSSNQAQNRNSVHTALPGQIENNTGGFVYSVSDKARLERFLILGTDGGTYYVSENDLTKQNVDWLISLIQKDPGLVLHTVLDVSTGGRAFKQNPAIFTMALLVIHASSESGFKAMAVSRVPDVCRTATALYQFAQFIEDLGGWGRAKRRAVAEWFTKKTPDQLAYQAVKYRQRNGWTLKDLMRLSHPVGVDQRVGNFILGKESYFGGPDLLAGFHEMQRSTAVSDVLFCLEQFPNLPWETIPTQFLKDPKVWKALFYGGDLRGQALVRNVVRLARIGAFDDMVFAADYANALTNAEMIEKTRLHPIQFLMAQVTYTEGQAARNDPWSTSRSKDWTVSPNISKGLHEGFYVAFKTVEPANSRTMIGVDVSGSMSWGTCAGSDLTPAQAAAAMAMVTTRVEPYVSVLGFANTLRDLNITPEDSFDAIKRKTSVHNFGSTNPSLLFRHAGNNGIDVDTFIIITDNEVNSGTHPSRELKAYRDRTGINAKLVVMGMTATDFTIADPNDPGMLDVCGFDSNTPKVVSDFSAGRL